MAYRPIESYGLIGDMRTVDLLVPGRRVPREEHAPRELAELTDAFNDMIDRLEHERQASVQLDQLTGVETGADAARVAQFSLWVIVACQQRTKPLPAAFGIGIADDHELLAIAAFGFGAGSNSRLRRVA